MRYDVNVDHIGQPKHLMKMTDELIYLAWFLNFCFYFFNSL